MCYSGKCRWEGYMGDCGFPNDKEVREKYPLPVCDIPIHETEEEYLNYVHEDIKKMLKRKKMKNLIKDIIKPENDTETAIVNDVDFIVGCGHGKPRRGHPEGKVIYHVQEVLKNIDIYTSNDDNRSDLRLIALVHDTFKHKVDRSKPKVGKNHHGMIAREFASKYVDDKTILKIIELHDEAYNAWSMGNRKNRWNEAKKRANKLINVLLDDDTLDLYLKFYHCDNLTGDKTNDDFEWFEELTFNV